MNTVRLTDCCRFFSGGTPAKGKGEYWRGQIPWFSPKDVKSFELISSQDQVSEMAVKESATRLMAAGTIFLVGRSGVLAHTLPVGVIQQPSAFNQDIKAIVPNADQDPEFLAFWLMANQSRVLRDGVKRGPTVHSLIAGFIEELEVPRVSLAEQRNISKNLKAQLSDVDAASRAAQVQWEAAAVLRSKCLEALFAQAGESKPIGAVAKLQSGYAFKSDEFKTAGVRLLRNANILPGRVYWDDAVFLSEAGAARHAGYSLSDGDVLISLDRPIISSGIKVARVGVADLPALLVQRVGRFLFDPAELDADYLYVFLQTDSFIAAISGHEQSVGVPHISPSQVEAVEMPLPELSVQQALAKRANGVLQEWATAAAAMQSMLKDLEQLPQRILAQAFDF